MNNDKLGDLERRTIILLEKTKKKYSKYAQERKILFNYLSNKNEINDWENYIEKIEKIIKN